MGELGRLLAGPACREIVERLTRAFADEWFAHYNFRFAGDCIRGHYAPDIVRWLRGESSAALRRADHLSKRLRELGAAPPAKLLELTGASTDKPFKLPPSMSDVPGVLKAVLDAERTSIRTYQTLHHAASEDALTAALALRLLSEAVAAEEYLERLIADPAPKMDGT